MNLDVIIGLRDPYLEKQKFHLFPLCSHLFYYFTVVCLNCNTPWGLKTIKGQWEELSRKEKWGWKIMEQEIISVMVKGKQDQGGLQQWTTSNKDFWKSPIKPSRAEASWKVYKYTFKRVKIELPHIRGAMPLLDTIATQLS